MTLRRSVWPLGLVFASAASAQTGRLVPTLESLIAPADRVFTGKVVQVARESVHSALDQAGDGQFDLVRYTLTVAVEKEIKGRGTKTVLLQFGAQDDRSFWRDWIEPQKSYLWSVGGANAERWGPLAYVTKQNTRANGSLRWLALDIDDLSNRETSYYGYFTLPLLTASLDVLRSRPDALARAEAFARAHPTPIPVIESDLPREFVSRKGIDPNAYPAVTFPKNAATEATARRLIEHPEEFVGTKRPRYEDSLPQAVRDGYRRNEIMQARQEGIRLLGSFKSDRNVRLLKSLLNDTALLFIVPSPNDPSPPDREYKVRRAAYDALKAWSVEVEPIPLSAPAA